MFKLKSLHLMAVFILIYIGVEVTLGGQTYAAPSMAHLLMLIILRPFTGWIVTYVIDLRGGGPSAGYISSGFFGGTLCLRVSASSPRSHSNWSCSQA